MIAVIHVFSAPDAAVVVGVLTLSGSLIALWTQNRKTHRENRADHFDTSKKVDKLLEAQGDIAADVRDVKADVRSHSVRLRDLEVTVGHHLTNKENT
jgi:uncharacterized protein YlxW (UPF0749 family)